MADLVAVPPTTGRVPATISHRPAIFGIRTVETYLIHTQGAPVVYDDDSRPPETSWIDPDGEPLPTAPPRNADIRRAILEVAHDNPHWGPLTVYEELVRLGYDIEEAEVNYVLIEYDLPNLRLL
jgi:hypothetical protein